VIVAEMLEADRVHNIPPNRLMLRRGTPFRAITYKDHAAVIVAEMLEADRVHNIPPNRLMLRRGTPFRAITPPL